MLLLLANEFDTQVNESMKVKQIIDAILAASDYEEETGKLFLERILEEIETEKLNREKQIELEKLERERQIEMEKLERQRQEKQIEREELEKARNFELEKLRLENRGANTGRSFPEGIPKKSNLKDLVPKFDPKAIDISLFLMIFERQAAREKIDDGDLVSQLIPLLPIEVSEQILKEPDDKAYDFTHVKRLLFKRFKLSSRALRNKFETHNRKPDVLWSDLVYELRVYLNNWLESVRVENFESLKELMLTEQLKKRVPLDIREHYLDSWDESNDPTILAEKV